MPVRDFVPEYSDAHKALVRQLAAEWTMPNGGASEPIINIERDHSGLPAHVYVVWSQWSLIERIERSEIIMEAANFALQPSEVINITLAMGLTPEEAPLMGIQV